MACVEIREAYLSKESSETIKIEKMRRRGGALSVHLVEREGGGGTGPGRRSRRGEKERRRKGKSRESRGKKKIRN